MATDSDFGRRLGEERIRLETLRDGIRGGDSVASTASRESIGNLSSVDQHAADAGTETEVMEEQLSLLTGLEGELGEVEAAQQRLRDGTYGSCMACGAAISLERLEALPATPFCIVHAPKSPEVSLMQRLAER